MTTNEKKSKNIIETISDAVENAGDTAKKIGSAATQIRVEDILRQAMKVPLVKIERAKFLKKELIRYYPEDVVEKAIGKNPAFAGVEREKINEIAKQVINYETNKVSAVSFAAGMPGGLAMAATIPADITQYFAFILRVMQKLAYLYGFDEFDFNEDEVSDEAMNQVMIFMGVMFGVQGANAGVKTIAEAAAIKVSRSLAQKYLTQTTVYPIVKKIAQNVGIRMTKQIFAESVSKVVPVVGVFVCGGLTYATFKPCSYNLQKSFKELNLSDPEFYKQIEE